MILLVDNYDSFTFNLYQYLRRLGRETRVLRSDAVGADVVAKLNPELIVLSPGPGGPSGTGGCLEIIEAFHKTVPILGVCLGMQTLAHYFGGRVVPAEAPVHGKVRLARHDGAGLFRGLPNPLRVTRYHSLVVEAATLPSCLRITAWSEKGEVMALQHKEYPAFGVQFHPEAYLTECGMELLANALDLAQCSPAR